MKKVTLFWPPIPNGPLNFVIYPSMGMAYLDSVLREKFEVQIVDANLLHPTIEFYKWYNEGKYGEERARGIEEGILKKMITITERTNPEILGVGSWTYNMPFIAEFTREFKARNPDIPLILGGINPTLIPDETLQTLPYVDYLVRGEGEYTFPELVQKITKKKSASKVKGVSFIKDKQIVHTENRPAIKNLDSLPFMDYDNFLGFDKWYKENGLDFIQVMTSRGCVANCSFCTVHQVWKSQRFYSDEYVLKQMSHMLDLYNFKNDIVAFMDDNFVASFEKTKRLIEKFKEKFPEYIWQIVDMRIDALSEGFLQYVRKKGCEFIGFGVESINASSLKFMNKTLNPEQYKRRVFNLLDTAEKLKIRTMLSSILGTPNETREEMLNQANFYVDIFNKHPHAGIDVEPLVVHPATPLWYKYKKGEMKIYKRPKGAPKRFYEGLFADKWDHLVEMVPNSYRIPNENMTKEEFESILKKIFEILFPLSENSRAGLIREKQYYIEV